VIVLVVAAVGGIALFSVSKRTPQMRGNVPPLQSTLGPVNTPQAAWASLAGQAATLLATQGVNALADKFD